MLNSEGSFGIILVLLILVAFNLLAALTFVLVIVFIIVLIYNAFSTGEYENLFYLIIAVPVAFFLYPFFIITVQM